VERGRRGFACSKHEIEMCGRELIFFFGSFRVVIILDDRVRGGDINTALVHTAIEANVTGFTPTRSPRVFNFPV